MLLISVTVPQEQYYERVKDPHFFLYYISWLMRKWTITWGTTWRVGAMFSPADLSGEKPVGCKRRRRDGTDITSLSSHVNGRRQLCQNKEMNDSGNTALVEVLFFSTESRLRRTIKLNRRALTLHTNILCIKSETSKSWVSVSDKQQWKGSPVFAWNRENAQCNHLLVAQPAYQQDVSL